MTSQYSGDMLLCVIIEWDPNPVYYKCVLCQNIRLAKVNYMSTQYGSNICVI